MLFWIGCLIFPFQPKAFLATSPPDSSAEAHRFCATEAQGYAAVHGSCRDISPSTWSTSVFKEEIGHCGRSRLQFDMKTHSCWVTSDDKWWQRCLEHKSQANTILVRKKRKILQNSRHSWILRPAPPQCLVLHSKHECPQYESDAHALCWVTSYMLWDLVSTFLERFGRDLSWTHDVLLSSLPLKPCCCEPVPPHRSHMNPMCTRQPWISQDLLTSLTISNLCLEEVYPWNLWE